MRATSASDNSDEAFAAVAELVATEASERVVAFVGLLREGLLSPQSTVAVIQDRLGLPGPRLAIYSRVLAAFARSDTNGGEAGRILEAALAAATRVRKDAPMVEVARTGPTAGSLDLRTTGAVSRDVIEGSRSTLLIVGYSVVIDAERSGLAARTIDAITRAAARGVAVTAVLHREPRNRAALLAAWPGYAQQPSIFTWPELPDDAMAKVHAKVIVCDRVDALVTSANLTYHGLEANIELGIRVTGPPAGTVEAHFRDLIRLGELAPWPE